MTAALQPPTEPPDPLQPRSRYAPFNLRRAIIVQIIVMIGLGTMLYPNAADWFARANQNSQVTRYQQMSAEVGEVARSAALRVADEYNSRMPQGPLRDLYLYDPSAVDSVEAYAVYEELLRVQGTQTIGRISYPDAGIYMPVYHGTEDDAITRGAGHLYGSSLPIGGPSTHSVLTAHSGLANARLFTPLLKSEVGEEFSVEVLGEKHYYRVDQIRTVEANDTRALEIIENKDYVTLLTCTPIGVNSHRILVRGERIDAPGGEWSGQIDPDEVVVGPPWWAIAFLTGSVITGMLLFRPWQAAPRPYPRHRT